MNTRQILEQGNKKKYSRFNLGTGKSVDDEMCLPALKEKGC